VVLCLLLRRVKKITTITVARPSIDPTTGPATQPGLTVDVVSVPTVGGGVVVGVALVFAVISARLADSGTC
jgi:hypothetical protein